MDRDRVIRTLAIAGAALLFFKYGLPKLTGEGEAPPPSATSARAPIVNAPGFAPDAIDPPTVAGQPNAQPPEGQRCVVRGDRFEADLFSRGAAITHIRFSDRSYAVSATRDVSSTPDHERWRSLRTTFREAQADTQFKYDRFAWQVEPQRDPRTCTFTYADADVRVEKTIAAHAERPFELDVSTRITNLTSEARRHKYGISAFAFRKNSELKGSLGRVSPLQTELSCASGQTVQRKSKDDLKQHPFSLSGVDRYASLNTLYFTQALVPLSGGPENIASGLRPDCELSIENWKLAAEASSDDSGAGLYQARLAYPAVELAPQQSALYRDAAYFGPKERDILAHAAGGKANLLDVVNLGFFAPVAHILIKTLDGIHDYVTFGNWGIAVIVMTLALRTLLFPLTYKSIQTTIAMRRLKPEVDALNAKFADDAQAKNLAMMELWKKHGVNPFGGCLPQLVQMPVWFAMYTTLQNAVQMYHTHFLWFDDLSAPDKWFILPVLLGAANIIQQRIVPQQGMDPVQAKMMLYVMPAVMTLMMLFLPAALGIYMFTNSAFGIAQQFVLEKVAPRSAKPAAAT